MPNTIAENLTRLQTARTDIANAITTMGGTVASEDGFEDFPAGILGIPVGGEDIQFSHVIGYTCSSSSTTSDALNVYSPSSCTIFGATTSSIPSITIPIITTNSNVFICIPVHIGMGSSKTASISYNIPSGFPSKYGYKANTMTLHSYYNLPGMGSCTVSASKFNFSVGSVMFANQFGDFILKFDKT